MKVLLCSNGTTWANRALEMGQQIALVTASQVDVLLVGRSAEQLQTTQQAADAAISEMQSKGISVTVYPRLGQLAESVIEQAHAAAYDLVVIGSRGRRGVRRLFLGSVAIRVMEHSPTSVLVVKGRRRDPKHFLVCSAASPVSERAIRFASQLARAADASVTLIHVMSQVPLTQKADMVDLAAAADDLIRRGSREGSHLSQMLDLLKAEGVQARAVVRHGLILDEILAEAREGQFGLLVIGAHVAPGVSSLLAGDLAEEILLAADLPVLVVRRVKPDPAGQV